MSQAQPSAMSSVTAAASPATHVASPSPTPTRTPASATSSAKKPQMPNTIGLYAVQCSDCMKWRLISNEEEYEKIRSKLLEDPYKCNKKPNVTCDDPADIEKDATRTWVIDKPNIPRTPSGFKRKLVLRRDFSKLDAHYVTPSGKKVRSSLEVAKYLEENPEVKGVAVSDFSFTVPKVVEDTIPKEVIEKKKAKEDKKAKEAKEPKEIKANDS